jgi:hypothetical protein
MKRVIISTIISISAGILAGCARPCFYQAGRNIEQAKRDLLQCIQEANNSGYGSKKALLSSADVEKQDKRKPAEIICSCMQTKGYQYLDLNELPPNKTHIMVAAPFQKYWLVNGAVDKVSEKHKILSEQKAPPKSLPKSPKKIPKKIFQKIPDSPVKRNIKYIARKNKSGELMRDSSGNYTFDPVYDEGQQETAAPEHNNEK